jgi:hypothetical protein
MKCFNGLLPLVLNLDRLNLFRDLSFLKDVHLSYNLSDYLGSVLSLNDLIINMIYDDDLNMLGLYLA